jgi:hypothetical protein
VEVRNDASTREPGRGPSQSLLKKVLTQGIETAAKTLLTSRLGEGPAESISQIAKQLVGNAVDNFTPPEGVARGSKLQDAATEFASGYLDRLLTGLAGTPPTTSDANNEKNVRYLNSRTSYTTQVEGGWKLRLPNHFLSAAFKALGIPDVFGEGINQAVTQAKGDREAHDLGSPGGWLKTISYLFAGILRDNNQEALAKILESVPAAAVTAPKPQDKPVDVVEAKPQTEMNEGTSASSTAPRGSNFASFYISERAYGVKAGKKENPKIESTEELVKHVLAEVLRPGAEIPADQITALAKDIQRSLQPLERESKVDQVGVIQELLKLLMADSMSKEKDAKGLRSAVKGLEGKIQKLGVEMAKPENQEKLSDLQTQLDAAKAELTTASKKAKDAEAAAGRQATWSNLSTYFTMFGRLQQGGMDLSASPGIDKALNCGIAFMLEKLVAQRFGMEIAGDSLTGVLKKYSGILHNLRDNGALSARAREKFEKAKPDAVFAPLFPGVDPKDPAGTAQKLAKQLLEGFPDQSKVADIAKAFEAVLSKSETNIDIVTHALEEIKTRTGLTEKDLGIDQLVQVMGELQGSSKEVIEGQKQLEDLDKAIRNINDQILALDPHGASGKFDGLQAKRTKLTERQTEIDSRLDTLKTDIDKLEKKLARPSTKNKPAVQEQLDKLKKEQHGLQTRDKAEIETQLKALETEIAGLDKTVASHADPQAKDFFEARWELGKAQAKLAEMEKADPKPPQADIDAVKTRIANLEKKIADLKTPEREAYAETRTKLRVLTQQRSDLGDQRKALKNGLKDHEYRRNQMYDQTHQAADQMLQMLAGAVINGDELKKKVEEDKAEREKAATKEKDRPRDPRDPNGPGGSGGHPGMSPAQRKKAALVQERIKMCDLILSDPSLSTQDKILLFILTYAEYKKREQEDDLRSFNKTEERRNEWQSQRQEMEKKIDAQKEVAEDLSPKMEKAKAELDRIPDKNSPQYQAKVKEFEGLKSALETANNEIKIGSETLTKHDNAPEARQDREMSLMLIERSMQEYDHLLRMADSLLQRYDRLVDQILRSMGQ